jgi:UDP-N-acetylmuramate dehydrogenase
LGIRLLIQENKSLASQNTFGLDVIARFYCEAGCDDEINEALAFANSRNLEVVVLGGGSNIVFTRNVDGLVIVPSISGIDINEEKVVIGSGENWHKMVRYCLKNGLSGIENLSLIPGCAGAAPIQNIGAYGQELSDVFVELQGIHRFTGEKLSMNRVDCKFAYRESVFKNDLKDQVIITGITLSLAKKYEAKIDYRGVRTLLEGKGIYSPRAIDVSDAVIELRSIKLPNPTDEGNVGSFFKNPIVSVEKLASLSHDWPELPSNEESDGRHKIHAAWLIEKAGLKGKVVGGAMVSEKHALVIVNTGHASCSDVLELRDEIQTGVEREFDIRLDIEPTFY